MVDPFPSLFSLRLDPRTSPLRGLQGVRLDDVSVSFAGKSARGPLHVTSGGVAGPAVLRLSSLAAEDLAACGHRCDVLVTLVPDVGSDDVCRALRDHADAADPGALLASRRRRKLVYPPLLRGHVSPKLWRVVVEAALASEVARGEAATGAGAT